MKGLVKTARGVGNLEYMELPEPTPGPGEVKVRVEAVGLCGTDIHIQRDEYPYTPPQALGHELAGEVVAVGEGVTRVKPGDRITSETYFYTCGKCRYCRAGKINLCLERKSIGSHVHGAMAEYLIIKEQMAHLLPDNVDYIAGALTEPVACCVHGLLETAKITPGDVVVVSGPGAIGLSCMQVARAAGATTVVLGANGDEPRLELAARLGADVALNVMTEDAGKVVRELTGGWGADVVVESAGVGPSVRQCLEYVRRSGQMVQMGLFGGPASVDLNAIAMKEVVLWGSFAQVPSSWPRTLRLLAQGQVKTRPLVSATIPLSEWQRGFDAFAARTECKIVLLPGR